MNEIRLKIRVFGDPVLRRKAKAVKKIAASHSRILSQMAQLMYDSGGVGLAAPQVGINQAMIVVDAGSGLYKLINPRIVQRQGSQVLEEGCLSVPGVCLKIKRAKKIVLLAQDEEGETLKIEAQDLSACVFQHEIDHLRGRLIVDYACVVEKFKIRRRLIALRRKTNEKLSESKTKSCKLQL
jgi:peptide deformylase